jgi:DNA (cytosine-5)-methyltransferase 1
VFRVLSLGCGQGGTDAGIAQAGFLVDGVDIEYQKRYPFKFCQGDMLDWPLEGYDAIFVAPPCQRWTKQLRCRPELRETYPDLITPMRPRLEASGVPYVIENVEGAPLLNPVRLCAAMFGKEMYRHRLFECGGGFQVCAPPHPEHRVRASRAGHWEPGTYFSMSGHVAPMWKAREVMEIDWMPRESLAEAVPPYMSRYIALHLRAWLERAA